MATYKSTIQKNNLVVITWNESFWFFDIDDLLIDTANTSIIAAEGIIEVLTKVLDTQKTKEIITKFNKLFNIMVAGYRVKSEEDWNSVPGGKQAYESLIQRVEQLQEPIIKNFGGIKKWSREVFLDIAAETEGVSLQADIINKAIESYWNTLTRKTTVLPGVIKLIKAIRNHNRPIFLLTSSDARLIKNDRGLFEYNPPYSMELKRKRIETLRDKGIDFDTVSIGDPEDKPHKDFFDKGIATAQAFLGDRQKINPATSLMFGDSYGGDLKTPKDILGFGLVVLVQKDVKATEVVDTHQINTNNVSDVIRFIK